MKITLDLPDWVDERNVRIFAGIELVAYRFKDAEWHVKTDRCSMCGRCCTELGPNHIFPVIDGQCIHLQKQPGIGSTEWLCRLGTARPFGCCAATPAADYCSIRYQPVADGPKASPGLPDDS